MITTINAFRKLNENLYPEGDFIKYNYNDTPDVEEYMNQAAQAMGEMTDSLYWMETQEVEEISGIMKDITGDESYDLDKVEAYSTKQGTVKIYIHSGDTGSYFIICNMNMNGKKIVDDQIVDLYENDYSEVTPEDSNDFKGYGKGENGEDDVDPSGGTGLASHESRLRPEAIDRLNAQKRINKKQLVSNFKLLTKSLFATDKRPIEFTIDINGITALGYLQPFSEYTHRGVDINELKVNNNRVTIANGGGGHRTYELAIHNIPQKQKQPKNLRFTGPYYDLSFIGAEFKKK